MNQSVLVTAREVCRDQGVKALSILAFKKAVRPIASIGSLYFLERDLSQPMPALRQTPGIIARLGTIDDIPLLDVFESAEHQKRAAAERLRSGERWSLAIEEATGKLACNRWVSTTSGFIPELDRVVHVSPHYAYVYGLETVRQYRRRGIEALTRQFMYNHLYRHCGISRILVYICADNYASLQAARKYLTPTLRVWYIRTAGRVYTVVNGNGPMPTLTKPAVNATSKSGNMATLGSSVIPPSG
jgi:hypothetical protein